MKTNLRKLFTVLAIFLCFFAALFLFNNDSKLSSQNRLENPKLSADFTFENIEIDGNIELEIFCAANGTGDGLSWSSAYRIENYSIDANRSGTGFELKNTDKYIILRNLTMKNSGLVNDDIDSGIKIDNCTNIRIVNCSVSSNLYGISIRDSTKISVSTSFTGNNNTVGIFLLNSNNIEISQNEIINNSLHGVYIKNSDLNNISNNEIINNSASIIYLPDDGNNGTNSGSGVFLSGADNNSVQNNDILFNPIGLYLKFSTNNVVSNNNFQNYSICIKIFESQNNIITNNVDCDTLEIPIIPTIPGYENTLILIFCFFGLMFLQLHVRKKIIRK